jgi:hypothetical protein
MLIDFRARQPDRLVAEGTPCVASGNSSSPLFDTCHQRSHCDGTCTQRPDHHTITVDRWFVCKPGRKQIQTNKTKQNKLFRRDAGISAYCATSAALPDGALCNDADACTIDERCTDVSSFVMCFVLCWCDFLTRWNKKGLMWWRSIQYDATHKFTLYFSPTKHSSFFSSNIVCECRTAADCRQTTPCRAAQTCDPITVRTVTRICCICRFFHVVSSFSDSRARSQFKCVDGAVRVSEPCVLRLPDEFVAVCAKNTSLVRLFCLCACFVLFFFFVLFCLTLDVFEMIGRLLDDCRMQSSSPMQNAYESAIVRLLTTFIETTHTHTHTHTHS